MTILMKKIFLSTFVIMSIICSIHAQYAHEDVFPGITGTELTNKVLSTFKTSKTLDYNTARDTMFLRVYRVKDSVECIYSGHKLHLPIGVDPSTYLYNGGDEDGINTEHTYPQSKGAKFGIARSDMHHLFPARVSVNEERSSLPFAEIPDNKTLKWFYQTYESTNIPGNATIDLYSEKWTQTWEPRESVKGDIARAIFYFYTMYKEEADNADSDFFDIQKDVLCSWHYEDPVDSLEWHRNVLKSKWQENKKNPFILDCSLVGRMYCSNVPNACAIIPTNEEEITHSFRVIQNPVSEELRFESNPMLDQLESFRILSLQGKLVAESDIVSRSISVGQLEEGIYFLQLRHKQGLHIPPIKFVKTN